MSGALRNRSDSTLYSGQRYRGIEGQRDRLIVHWFDGGGRQADLPARRSMELKNLSPHFDWGYGGSAPAQLALAILYHFTRKGRLSLRLYQQFKIDHVCGWADSWQITGGEIRKWLAKQEIDAAHRFVDAHRRHDDIDTKNADSLQSLKSFTDAARRAGVIR